MSNLTKSILIINAAKKGWSDAARKKAAMTRKRKSLSIDEKIVKGRAIIASQEAKLLKSPSEKLSKKLKKNKKLLSRMETAVSRRPQEYDKKSLSGKAYGNRKSYKAGDLVGVRDWDGDGWGHMAGKVVKTDKQGVYVRSADFGTSDLLFFKHKHVAYHGKGSPVKKKRRTKEEIRRSNYVQYD